MTQYLGVSSVDVSYDLAEFVSYMMQMKRTKGSHAMNKLDHYLDDDVLQRMILIFWHGGKFKMADIQSYNPLLEIY